MIPKVIHYCWFGRGKMPALASKCFESWKTYLPDYKLKLWNEESFDVNSITYVKEAYNARKFAFVTDYVRLHALYNYGGIYMDTDVEVIRNMDDLINYPAFSGFENEVYVPTGIIASEQHGEWTKEQLEYYRDRHFLLPDRTYDLTSNTQIISQIMSSNGFVLKNSYQVYNNCMHIFPMDYFCAKSHTGIVTITQNTYCIHHLAGSWYPLRYKVKRFLFRKIIRPKITDRLVNFKRFVLNKTINNL